MIDSVSSRAWPQVGGGWRQVAGLRLRTVAVRDLRESQIAPEPCKSATCRLRPRSRPYLDQYERSLRPFAARFSPPRTSRELPINHLGRLELEERLAVLDRLGVLDQDAADDPGLVGLELVEELHRLEDAERLAHLDPVALLDELRLGR